MCGSWGVRQGGMVSVLLELLVIASVACGISYPPPWFRRMFQCGSCRLTAEHISTSTSLRLAPNMRIGSSRSCRMLWRVTLATIAFSSRTAYGFVPRESPPSIPGEIFAECNTQWLCQFPSIWLLLHNRSILVLPVLGCWSLNVCRVISFLVTYCMGCYECSGDHRLYVGCLVLTILYWTLDGWHCSRSWLVLFSVFLVPLISLRGGQL